jgi:hypothetical protein
MPEDVVWAMDKPFGVKKNKNFYLGELGPKTPSFWGVNKDFRLKC